MEQEIDLRLYRVDVAPGDRYEVDSEPRWTLCCDGNHRDPRDGVVVDLRNNGAGPWMSYDMAELEEIIRKHHEKYHRRG
jgi:hypothetical protein